MAKPATGGDFTLEKSLPSNVEAERSILGAVLLDNQTINQAAERLKREDFFLESHRRIYEKMLYLSEQGRAIDPITLQEELRRAGDLDLIGGPAYIAALIDGVPRFSNIDNYSQIVKGKSILRRLIQTTNQIMSTCFDAEEEPEVILDQAERAILAIAEDRIRQGFVPVSEVAHKQLEYIEEIAGREQLITGIATGFRDLDYMTSGLQRGDLVIIAARPSVGKCLSADSEIVLADGGVATIEEIYRQGRARLLTLNNRWRFEPTSPSAFVDDGQKPVFRVTTRLGRVVESTLSHPFLTLDGWRPLMELRPGHKLAVPRRINIFGKLRIRDCEVKLLAYLIGDGCLTKTSPEFTNSDPVLQADFSAAVSGFPGVMARMRLSSTRAPSLRVTRDRDFIKTQRDAFAQALRSLLKSRPRGTSRQLALRLKVDASLIDAWQHGICVPNQEMFGAVCEFLKVEPEDLSSSAFALFRWQNKNPVTAWLQEHGLWGKGAHEKTVPPLIFKLRRDQVALFLNRLFATDGWASVSGTGATEIGYTTVSERLGRQLQHLLLRFGIIASLRRRSVTYLAEKRCAWSLSITHADSIRTFAAEVGILGKEAALARVLAALDERHNRPSLDTLPQEIWERLATAKGQPSWGSLARQAGIKGHTNIHVGRRTLSRPRLLAMSQVLRDQSLRDLATSEVYWDEIVAIEPVGYKQVYDLTIPETHNFVANDICVHNTAFCLNIAQNAAMTPQHHGEKAIVGIFSLEMSKEQLVQRLLCSQSRLDAHRLRTGMLSKDDWRRLALGVSELAEARIFIDDTPGISVLEMRAKARRLKNEQHRLDLLIIDYLQLMSGRGRVESRQQEVSQISRELKGLAKELNVPLIALSQLSRAPEARTDHRPQLADLRESGCLAGESLITLADSGAQVTIRDLAGQSGFAVWALNEETLKLERATVSRAFSTGIKPVFRLTTRLGRSIRATANHKFRTFAGWKRLDELKLGERLALPRSLSSPSTQSMTDAELGLLGHLIGDGCTLPRHVIQYTTREKDLAELVASLAAAVFGDEVAPRIKQERTWYQVYLSSTRCHTHHVHSAVVEWLMGLGIWGLRSYEKRIPHKVFEQPQSAVATFLRHLWATDGCIRLKPGFYAPAVYYATSSEAPARGVHSLLLRLGINAWLRRRPQPGKGRDQYHVALTGKFDLEQFAKQVGAVGGYKSRSLKDVVTYLQDRQANTNRDVIPNLFWQEMVVPAMRDSGLTTRQMMAGIHTTYCGTRLYTQNVSRARALRIAQTVHSEPLTRLAQSDVYWDQVISIQAEGEAEVYDLTVEKLHNFVANDVLVHNSIEQDSDVVMFIYREDVYNPETEKQNIAEIIIGKQRNGPIGKVELVFLKTLTRFENKAYE